MAQRLKEVAAPTLPLVAAPQGGAPALGAALRAAERARAAPVVDLLGVAGGLLDGLGKELLGTVASLPVDAHPEQISRARDEIAFDVAQTAAKMGAAAKSALSDAWQAGADQVEAATLSPALSPQGRGGNTALREAVSASVSGIAPTMTDSALKDALESFFVDRMKDVPAEVGRKIDTVLRLSAMGSLPTAGAITQVQGLLGSARRRAMTIVNTEMSRAFSVAAAQRAEEKQAAGTAMVKIWRRSGKIHSRLRHDLMDGKIEPVGQPFKLGNIKMMHPHDPAAPASETINCGCLALYRRADYVPTLPDKKMAPMSLPNVVRTAASDAALAGFAGEIGQQPLEHAVFVDANGAVVLRKVGLPDRVEFTQDELSLIKGMSMLHNHPGVGSFSVDDVYFAMAHELADMRVVDAWYSYRLLPPDTGWDVGWWHDVVKPLVDEAQINVGAEFRKHVADGTIPQSLADAAEFHEVWARVCKILGLRYTMDVL